MIERIRHTDIGCHCLNSWFEKSTQLCGEFKEWIVNWWQDIYWDSIGARPNQRYNWMWSQMNNLVSGTIPVIPVQFNRISKLPEKIIPKIGLLFLTFANPKWFQHNKYYFSCNFIHNSFRLLMSSERIVLYYFQGDLSESQDVPNAVMVIWVPCELSITLFSKKYIVCSGAFPRKKFNVGTF